MSSRSPFSRVAALFGAGVAIAIFPRPRRRLAPRAQGPILVFPLASSVDDVPAAQSVTSLESRQRLRFVYGDQVKLVADLGSESLVDVVKRTGAKYYIGGSIVKTTAGAYSVDLQGRAGDNNAIEGEQRFTLAAPDAIPQNVALASLIDGNPLVSNMRYVLVPLEVDKTMGPTDTYATFTQQDLVKTLAAKGINATVVESMDPVDARIGAPDLCKDNNATGVIVGSEWHKQDYKQGAVKSGAKGLENVLTIVPIAGPIMAGMVNAGANAASSVGASNDKYPAKAEVDLTLLSCEGKRIWSGTGPGRDGPPEFAQRRNKASRGPSTWPSAVRSKAWSPSSTDPGGRDGCGLHR